MNDHTEDPPAGSADDASPGGQLCPTCRSPLPPGYSSGLCPACLFLVALGEGETAVDERIEAATSPQRRLRYLGDYELEEELGRGGMGVVYRATQTSLGRPVAVKLLIEGRWASEEARRRFQLEARAAASLDHPSIIKVHEVGESEGQPYFSMDLVEGEDLAGLLKSQRPPIAQAVRWMIEMCDAVVCAHGRGIAHRDLKPSNVIIDRQNRPVVTDFGLARIERSFAESAPLTQTGQVFGTPGYIAPERLRGVSTNASGEDIYALGAILHALLTGHPPFHLLTSWSALSRAIEKDLPSLRRLNPEIPADLDAICLKALSRRPEDRYASVADLHQDLERFSRGLPVVARPIPVWTRGWRWLKRRRRTVATAAVFAILTSLAVFRNQVAQVAVKYERAEGQKAQDLLGEWAEVQEALNREQRGAAAEALGRVARAVRARPAGDQLVGGQELRRAAFEAWRLPTLEPAWRLPVERPLALAFSSDGKRLGVLDGRGRSQGGEPQPNGLLQIYDLAEGDLEQEETVVLSPDVRPERLADPRVPGQPLPAAASAERENIALVFAPTCGCLKEITIHDSLRLAVPELGWTWGSGHGLAYVVPPHSIEAGGQEPGSPRQHLGQIIYVDRNGRHREFALRGLPVALAAGRRLVFFDGDSLKIADTLDGEVGDGVAPGRLIHSSVTGLRGLYGNGGRGSTWVHRDGGAVREIPERPKSHHVTSSPRGGWIAILDSNRRRIRLYDAITPGPESLEINLTSGAVALPFQSSQISPDRRFISLVVDLGNRRRQIQVRRLSDGEHLFSIWDQFTAEWSPDGRFLVTRGSLEGERTLAPDHSRAERANPMNRGISVWRLKDPVTTLDVHATRRRSEGETDGVLSLKTLSSEALVADDRFIDLRSSPSLDQSLNAAGRAHGPGSSPIFRRRYLMADGRFFLVDLLRSPKDPRDAVLRADAPPFRLFRQGVWTAPKPPEADVPGRLFVLGLELAGDGRTLWTVGRHRSADGRMSSAQLAPLDVWDAESGEHLERLSEGRAFEVVPSPRGDWVAVAGLWAPATGGGARTRPQPGVRIWHAESRRLLAHLPHGSLPRGACWDHSGRTLISGAVDGRILWSRLSAGAKVEATAESPTTLDMITALAAGDDGLMAAGDSTGKILLFRIEGDRLEEVLTFQGHPSLIRTLLFHAETGALFSGDAEGKLRHWDLKDLSGFERRVLGKSILY
ncbi:MAG: WD40 repeat domain-containing serine/threonine-protein kinase [Acidobacteriota bacterium]